MTITIADGRGELWQWDTGRRVKITDGVGVKQIHYQNKCFGRSVDVDVGADGTAIIPDELLQDWHPLTAYAYVTDDAGGYTKAQADFAVHRRARPADYVYTPTEHAGFDRLHAEIGDLSALQTDVKDNLVAAINEAAASGGSSDAFVVNGTIDPDSSESTSEIPVTLDKTVDQIRAAINDGKRVIARVAIEIAIDMPLVSFDTLSDNLTFAGVISAESGLPVIAFLLVRADSAILTTMATIALDADGNMPQVRMDADPTRGMQIATKQYVDGALDGKAGTAEATTGAAGLMSATDKTKLDGIGSGANKTIVPAALKNPNALTIKIGGTTVTYDGSAAKTVTIADGSEVAY